MALLFFCSPDISRNLSKLYRNLAAIGLMQINYIPRKAFKPRLTMGTIS